MTLLKAFLGRDGSCSGPGTLLAYRHFRSVQSMTRTICQIQIRLIAFGGQTVRAHLEQIVRDRGSISRASSRRGGCLADSSGLHQLHCKIVWLSTLTLVIHHEQTESRGIKDHLAFHSQ